MVKIAQDLAEALKILHYCGFVHADIKPDNIINLKKKHPKNLLFLGIVDSFINKRENVKGYGVFFFKFIIF